MPLQFIASQFVNNVTLEYSSLDKNNAVTNGTCHFFYYISLCSVQVNFICLLIASFKHNYFYKKTCIIYSIINQYNFSSVLLYHGSDGCTI